MSTGFIQKLDPPHSFPFLTNTKAILEKPIPFSELPAPTDLSGKIVNGFVALRDKFDAKTMDGLLLWLDANDSKMFVNTTLKDKSNNNYSSYSTLNFSKQTTLYGKNYIALDYPSEKIIVSQITLRPTFTLFFIGRTGLGLFVFDASLITGLASGIYVSTYSANLLFTTGAYLSDTQMPNLLSPVVPITDVFLFAIGYDLTLQATPYRVNGVNRATYEKIPGFVEENTSFTTDLSIYAWPDQAFPSSLFGELLIYNRSLSLEETQQMEGYLADKWNLKDKLPSNHPYKNGAPQVV
jgi:hypothetical protein